MRYLVTSMKGGVGKSSIALNLAAYTGSQYITNDITIPRGADIIQIPPGKKRIPKELSEQTHTVFDFGALSTLLDPKIAHAARFCDVIIIPTRTDPRSITATIKTFQLVEDAGKPIVVVINHFKDSKKHDFARDRLLSALGRIPIFAIRETTLFDRVSRDGVEWFVNIHNERGAHRLQQTAQYHSGIYDRITAIGRRGK